MPPVSSISSLSQSCMSNSLYLIFIILHVSKLLHRLIEYSLYSLISNTSHFSPYTPTICLALLLLFPYPRHTHKYGKIMTYCIFILFYVFLNPKIFSMKSLMMKSAAIFVSSGVCLLIREFSPMK